MTIHRLRVDFGDVAEADLLPAYGGLEVKAGAAAILFDGDGNSCLGTITDVADDGFCHVRPAWQFWLSGKPQAFAPLPTSAAKPFGFTLVISSGTGIESTDERHRHTSDWQISALAGVPA